MRKKFPIKASSAIDFSMPGTPLVPTAPPRNSRSGFVCLKEMAGELLQLLLKFTGRRDDGPRHHDGVTTASGTEPVKAGIGVCVADHDIRRIDGKLLRQYLRHNGLGAVSPERRIELRKILPDESIRSETPSGTLVSAKPGLDSGLSDHHSVGL